MKKITCCLCVLILLFLTSAEALAASDGEIIFLNIPWRTSDKETTASIENYFGMQMKKKTEERPSIIYDRSYNFADPAHVYMPYYESDNIKTKSIEYYAEKGKQLFAAGWPVYHIMTRYIQSNYVWKLFQAEYWFDLYKSDESLTYEMLYNDLYEKLSSKYGSPDETYQNGVQYYSLWYGANKTVMILSHDDLISESVRLDYGNYAVNDMFIYQIEKKKQEKEQEHQELINTIKEDNSGI